MVKKNDIDRTAQMMLDMVERSKSNRETAYQRISDRIDNIKRLDESIKRRDESIKRQREENKMKDERIKMKDERIKKARIFKELYPDIKTNIKEAFDKWLADGEPKPCDNEFDDFKRIFPDITANQEYHFERWKKACRPMPIEKKARKPRAPRKPKEQIKPKEQVKSKARIKYDEIIANPDYNDKAKEQLKRNTKDGTILDYEDLIAFVKVQDLLLEDFSDDESEDYPKVSAYAELMKESKIDNKKANKDNNLDKPDKIVRDLTKDELKEITELEQIIKQAEKDDDDLSNKKGKYAKKKLSPDEYNKLKLKLVNIKDNYQKQIRLIKRKPHDEVYISNIKKAHESGEINERIKNMLIYGVMIEGGDQLDIYRKKV